MYDTYIENPVHTPELAERYYQSRREHLEALILKCDARLAAMRPGIASLLDARHAVGMQPQSLFDVAQPTLEQLYEESTYNDVFVYGEDKHGNGGDLDTRKGKPFGEGEAIAAGDYADLIRVVAADFGLIRNEIVTASNPLDQEIGIADSTLESVGEVEAIVVPAAAGMSNVIRIRDAIRNLESGAVSTKRLIIATCERPVTEGEQGRLLEQFRGGNTESESVKIVLERLLGIEFNTERKSTFPVRFNSGLYEAWKSSQIVDIGGYPIEVVIVSTEYDVKRKKTKDKLADRADTFETFVAVNEILHPGKGTILIDSHDTWALGQGVIAEQVFSVAGKDVMVTGPQKLDRVRLDDEGNLSLLLPGAVVDEIAKIYAYTTQTRIRADNERQSLDREEAALRMIQEMGVNPEQLLALLTAPMPNLDKLRERKLQGYKDIPIDVSNPLYQESVIELKAFGVAGQNYYSRPNATIDEAIPTVEMQPAVRTAIAETLRTLNDLMAHPAVTQFFGGEVELYVEDGLRSPDTQDRLYTVEVPDLLKRNHPDWNKEQIEDRRDQIIAPASNDISRPSPHSTGGAVDVILRYRTTRSPLYVADRNVWIGHKDGDTGDSIFPDFFEKDVSDALATRNRRAFYSIMTGSAFGIQTGLRVNPTEIWHWSRGDQLWAMVSGSSNAYYGPAA